MGGLVRDGGEREEAIGCHLNSRVDQHSGARGGGGRAAHSIGGRTVAMRIMTLFLEQRPAVSGRDVHGRSYFFGSHHLWSQGELTPQSSQCRGCDCPAWWGAGAATPLPRCLLRQDHSRSPWPVATTNNLSSLSLSNRSWACWSRPFQDSGRPAAQGAGAGPGPPTQRPRLSPHNCGWEPGSWGGGAPGPKRGVRATLVSGVSGCSVSRGR